MAQPTWYDAAMTDPDSGRPVELPEGRHWDQPIGLHVDPGSAGDIVEIQFQDASGAWYTPTGWAFQQKGPLMIERTNQISGRIVARGTAKFQLLKV